MITEYVATDHEVTTLDGQNILYSVTYFVGLVAPQLILGSRKFHSCIWEISKEM